MKKLVTPLAFALPLLAIGFGFGGLARAESSAGEALAPPVQSSVSPAGPPGARGRVQPAVVAVAFAPSERSVSAGLIRRSAMRSSPRMSPQRMGWRLQQLEGELSTLRREADQHQRTLDQLMRAKAVEPPRVLERVAAGSAMALVLALLVALVRAAGWRAAWKQPPWERLAAMAARRALR